MIKNQKPGFCVAVSPHSLPESLFIILVTQTIQIQNIETTDTLPPPSILEINVFSHFFLCFYTLPTFNIGLPSTESCCGESQARLMDGHRNSEIFGHSEPLRIFRSLSFFCMKPGQGGWWGERKKKLDGIKFIYLVPKLQQ